MSSDGLHIPSLEPQSSCHLFYCNIQGLSRPQKSDELSIFLESLQSKPSLLCLSEHWLNAANIFVLNSLSGFKNVSAFCRSDSIRGGVCILAELGLCVDSIKFLSESSVEGYFECCGVLIKSPSPAVFVCVYRPPKNDNESLSIFFENLDTMLKKLFKKFRNFNITLAGDFNIDTCSDTQKKLDFLNALKSFNLEPKVSEPTRVTSYSKSCIDNIFTNYIPTCVDLVETGLSDHFGILVNIRTASNRNNKLKPATNFKRKFTDQNIQTFGSNLMEVPWPDLFSSNVTDVNSMFKSFMHRTRLEFFACFPLKPSKNNHKCSTNKWMTKGLSISSARKRYLHDLSKASNDVVFITYVRRYKLIFNKCVRLAKLKFNERFINSSKNKTKATWEVVKRETGGTVRATAIDKIVNNGETVTDTGEIADLMNQHFLNVCTKLGTKPSVQAAISFVPRTERLQELHFFQSTTEKEILNIIKSIKSKRSAGWDEISPFLLKKCSNSLVTPLTFLVNCSLQEGVFPNVLKFSCVKPIPKKPNSETLDQFRPISLLSTFSKIFEIVVCRRLVAFLNLNEFFDVRQFGFQRGKGTEDAIFDFLEKVSSSVDRSQFTVGAFCDLSKAFDCVDFAVLMAKLRCCGIGGVALDWLSSYFTDRQQKVVIDSNSQSNYEKVISGVPQGSILGPLLFLIYSNDLPVVINKGQVVLYADDTSVIVSHEKKESASNILLEQFQLLDKWFSANGLKLNPDKTQLVNFHLNNRLSPQNDSSYLPNCFSVVSSLRFLGVEIDSSLTWQPHINKLLPKLCRAYYAMMTLSHVVGLQTLREVYFAYFHSHLSYGITFWGNSSEAIKAFYMQKRIIRLMTKLPFNEPCRPLFKQLKILPLPSLHILKSLIFVYSNPDKFYGKNHVHQHFTRNSAVVQYPNHRTTFFEKAPWYSCTTLYNSLPGHIKSEPSLKSFKHKLHNLLLEHCFYSVPEYLAWSSKRST